MMVLRQLLWHKETVPKLVLDIGASDGRWSIELDKAITGWLGDHRCHYFMVEANPVYAPALQMLVQAKHRPGASFDYALKAMHDGSHPLPHLHAPPGWEASGSLQPQASVNDVEVEFSTVDEVCPDNGNDVMWMKLDTHGHEPWIFKKAEHTISQCSLLWVEAYNLQLKPGSWTFTEVIGQAMQRGFLLYTMVDPVYRPVDQLWWQAEFIFLKYNHPIHQRRREFIL